MNGSSGGRAAEYSGVPPVMRLSPESRQRPWGSSHTEPWYPNPERREIGEVWFNASDSAPLLVKFLFTAADLSVQVHPNDAYAREHEGSPGKTEMWHILRAEPAARVALGVKSPLTRARLREASATGEILGLLNWVPVKEGDTFLIPAGTIHAIGGGITLCEVQQRSDVTYRLYDYGRPRELHMDKALDVSELEPRSCTKTVALIGVGRELLAESDYFRTERLRVSGRSLFPVPRHNVVCVALEGEGFIDGEAFRPGDVRELPVRTEPIVIDSPNAVFLTTSLP